MKADTPFNETKEIVYAATRCSPGCTVHDISAMTGISGTSVRKYLTELTQAGLVRARKAGRRSAMSYAGNPTFAPYQVIPQPPEVMLPKPERDFAKVLHVLPDDYYGVVSAHLGLMIDGSDTDLINGPTKYHYGLRDLPILDWGVTVVSSERLDALADDMDVHPIWWVDYDIKAVITGDAIIKSEDISSAEFTSEIDGKPAVRWLYELNGQGNSPNILWLVRE